MLHAVGVCDQDSRFELQNRQGHRATNAFRRRGLAARPAPTATMRPHRLWAPAGVQRRSSPAAARRREGVYALGPVNVPLVLALNLDRQLEIDGYPWLLRVAYAARRRCRASSEVGGGRCGAGTWPRFRGEPPHGLGLVCMPAGDQCRGSHGRRQREMIAEQSL